MIVLAGRTRGRRGVRRAATRSVLIACLVRDDSPPVWGVSPAAHHLFRSVAKAIGPGALGVVLTRMSRDSADGLHAIRVARGGAIVQGPATSTVFGMHGAAVQLAGADRIEAMACVARAINAWTA